MLSLDKKNKKLNDCIEDMCNIVISENNNISRLLQSTISNPMLDSQLLSFYKRIGLKDYQLNVSHKLITEMPFNKNINLDFMKKSPNYKEYIIPKDKYEPVDYAIYDKMGNSYVPLVKFDEDIKLPMICEDNIGWMTPVLFEETTMRPCVEKAKGNILVVGLGIGFFPYNCLLKEDVKKITIIEYNQDIIDLFKENILPQFPRKDDVEIIQGDAYDYLNNEYIKKFDYTFVDIWRNDSDGVVILSNLFKNIDFSENLNIDFWVEDAILQNVKTSLIIYLIQMKRGNLKDLLTGEIVDSQDIENYITFDKIHRFFKCKNIKIDTKSSLIKFINDKVMLREMLKSF